MEQVKGPVMHGGLDYAELERLGLHPEEVLDFSVNVNPFGPSPRVREAIAQATLDRYPDRACLQLRRAILQYELADSPVPLSWLLCGNGASELIWAITHTLLSPGQKAAIIGPTFAEYRAACEAVGATIIEYHAQAAEQFSLDGAALAAWTEQEQPAVLWLCNPNNPTGAWLAPEAIQQLAALCARLDIVLVIDEAYWHFLLPPARFSAVQWLTHSEGASMLVLRSLTKAYALAGVRLGYLVGPEKLIASIRAHLPSWNVSSLAQAAGIAALADRIHLDQTLAALSVEREHFFEALHTLGARVVPSHTHFCLIDVRNARSIYQALLAKHILVRDCTSFGLPQYIRVATRQQDDWQRLVAALQEVL